MRLDLVDGTHGVVYCTPNAGQVERSVRHDKSGYVEGPLMGSLYPHRSKQKEWLLKNWGGSYTESWEHTGPLVDSSGTAAS